MTPDFSGIERRILAAPDFSGIERRILAAPDFSGIERRILGSKTRLAFTYLYGGVE